MTDELDGATAMPPENTFIGSPGEFAALWNARTDSERQRWIEGLQTVSARSSACFYQDHQGRLEILETLTTRIVALRARIAAREMDNAPINRFAAPDDQIPVVLTGEEVLAILNGDDA